MPLIETPGRQKPTAEDGAVRIRRTIGQTVNQMEQGLAQVRQVMKRHGKDEIKAALGADAAELAQVYKKLQKCINDIDATREVEDLPA